MPQFCGQTSLWVRHTRENVLTRNQWHWPCQHGYSYWFSTKAPLGSNCARSKLHDLSSRGGTGNWGAFVIGYGVLTDWPTRMTQLEVHVRVHELPKNFSEIWSLISHLTWSPTLTPPLAPSSRRPVLALNWTLVCVQPIILKQTSGITVWKCFFT